MFNSPIGQYLKENWSHHKISYIASYTLSAVKIVNNMAAPYFFTKAFSELDSDDPSAALPWLYGFAGSYVLSRVLPVVQDELLVPAGTELCNTITHDVVATFYALPMKESITYTTAPAVHHFGLIYEHIGRSFVDKLHGKLVPSFLELLAGTFLISAQFNTMGIIPGAALLTHFMMLAAGEKYVASAQDTYVKSLMKAYEYIISQLDEYQNVHYFGAVKKQLENLTARTTSLDSTLNKSVLLRERALFLQGGLITALSILGSGYMYIKDPFHEKMTLDDFIWVTLYLSLISPSLETLSQTVNKLIADYKIFQEANIYMESAQERESNDNILNVTPLNASITFENLTFRYIDNQVILDGLSLFVPAGKTLVITGSSGAGKSSILKILLRFYEQTSGNILINNQDITKVNATTLREAIAVVPQNPVLRNTSIYENIKYANPNASDAQILEAAKLAGLDDVIKQHGLGFEVGENGGKLSGGQKGRVAIARCYLRNKASILVLDEPTSALDPKTEKQILVDLDNLLKNSKKTAVIVTHKLASIRHLSTVDSIVFLDGGKIVEQGTLDELMAKDGLFAAQMKIADAEESLDDKRKPPAIVIPQFTSEVGPDHGLRSPKKAGGSRMRSLSPPPNTFSKDRLLDHEKSDDEDDDNDDANTNPKRRSLLDNFKGVMKK